MTTAHEFLVEAEELARSFGPESPSMQRTIALLKDAAALAEQARLLPPLIDQLETTLKEIRYALA